MITYDKILKIHNIIIKTFILLRKFQKGKQEWKIMNTR